MLISATRFKARCLALLEHVRKTGEKVIVTKHGIPVAEVIPTPSAMGSSPQDELKGTVEVKGDILGPVLPATAWKALSSGGSGSRPARKAGKTRRGRRR